MLDVEVGLGSKGVAVNVEVEVGVTDGVCEAVGVRVVVDVLVVVWVGVCCVWVGLGNPVAVGGNGNVAVEVLGTVDEGDGVEFTWLSSDRFTSAIPAQ